MDKICSKANKMKIGTFLISLTKKLPTSDVNYFPDEKDRDWECILSIKLPMSWGPATVNVHKKTK